MTRSSLAPARPKPGKALGLTLVLALHAALVWALWHYQLRPAPVAEVTLMVNLLDAPAPPKPLQPKPLPPKPPEPPKLTKPQTPPPKPEPQRLVASAPTATVSDYVAPEPKPLPPPVVTPAPTPAPPAAPPATPVTLSSELSVSCPDRAPPAYPALSRRLEETGRVVLKVELSESGHVSAVHVQRSSGYPRLDEAAMATVRSWHCTPPSRNGQPAKAVALQAFNFVLDN